MSFGMIHLDRFVFASLHILCILFIVLLFYTKPCSASIPFTSFSVCVDLYAINGKPRKWKCKDKGDTFQKVKVQGQGWHISESESGRTRVAKNVKTNLFIKVIQLPRPSIWEIRIRIIFRLMTMMMMKTCAATGFHIVAGAEPRTPLCRPFKTISLGLMMDDVIFWLEMHTSRSRMRQGWGVGGRLLEKSPSASGPPWSPARCLGWCDLLTRTKTRMMVKWLLIVVLIITMMLFLNVDLLVTHWWQWCKPFGRMRQQGASRRRWKHSLAWIEQ